jgi:hypothetical protein
VLLFFSVAQVTGMQVKVTGLKPGTAYAVRVRSVNAKGESEPSLITQTSTKPAGVFQHQQQYQQQKKVVQKFSLLAGLLVFSVPGNVEHVRFTSATADSVQLDWDGADAHGSPITSYEVQMSPGATKSEFYEVFSGTKNHTRVAGLKAQVRPISRKNWFGIVRMKFSH